MTYPLNIVKAFGGIRAMARATQFPPSTIANWLKSGAIHDAHKPAIKRAADVHGVALSEADFFPRPFSDPHT